MVKSLSNFERTVHTLAIPILQCSDAAGLQKKGWGVAFPKEEILELHRAVVSQSLLHDSRKGHKITTLSTTPEGKTAPKPEKQTRKADPKSNLGCAGRYRKRAKYRCKTLLKNRRREALADQYRQERASPPVNNANDSC